MERREFVRVTGSMLVFAMPLSPRAQTVTTIRRIGYLGTGVQPSPDELKQYYAPLSELGWIEGAQGSSQVLPGPVAMSPAIQ